MISPGGLLFYTGDLFPDWQDDALIPGLTAKAVIQVEIDGDSARESARFDMGKRIRAITQGPNGAIWLLEDRKGGRLLKLTPSVGG